MVPGSSYGKRSPINDSWTQKCINPGCWLMLTKIKCIRHRLLTSWYDYERVGILGLGKFCKSSYLKPLFNLKCTSERKGKSLIYTTGILLAGNLWSRVLEKYIKLIHQRQDHLQAEGSQLELFTPDAEIGVIKEKFERWKRARYYLGTSAGKTRVFFLSHPAS